MGHLLAIFPTIGRCYNLLISANLANVELIQVILKNCNISGLDI